MVKVRSSALWVSLGLVHKSAPWTGLGPGDWERQPEWWGEEPSPTHMDKARVHQGPGRHLKGYVPAAFIKNTVEPQSMVHHH